MENTLFESHDSVGWWIDRMGNMEFIDDQCNATYNPAFYWNTVRIADSTGFEFNGLI